MIKTHSAVGARMLLELPFEQQELPFVKTASEICRWHHERYDGNGYPDGLKGEQIPIAAQVVGLADVYDALTSKKMLQEGIFTGRSIKNDCRRTMRNVPSDSHPVSAGSFGQAETRVDGYHNRTGYEKHSEPEISTQRIRFIFRRSATPAILIY